jgi:hypothetical protein
MNENDEVREWRDKDVAQLDESYKVLLKMEGRKQLKDGGCKKRPLFFGPNKWANFTKAQKSQKKKQKQQKKGKGKKIKKKMKGTAVEESSEDDIHNNDSKTTGDSYSGSARQMIPVSKIQIVLHEGGGVRQCDENAREIRVEAERLFHIGMNLGITSNEERLGVLERMVELEIRDEVNFELVGGEEEVK